MNGESIIAVINELNTDFTGSPLSKTGDKREFISINTDNTVTKTSANTINLSAMKNAPSILSTKPTAFILVKALKSFLTMANRISESMNITTKLIATSAHLVKIDVSPSSPADSIIEFATIE